MINKNVLLVVFISLFMSLVFVSFVSGEVSTDDKVEIQNQIGLITNFVNEGDIRQISSLISPNSRQGLSEEIESKLVGRTIVFSQSLRSFEYLENNQIKVRGRFSASGVNWEINGFSNQYVFEKVGDEWLLVDTNFHERMDGSFILGFVGKILLFLLPVFLIFAAFWIWMLIDCAQRTFDDKMVWLLLIIFLGVLGALLYFFIIRRKLIRKKS